MRESRRTTRSSSLGARWTLLDARPTVTGASGVGRREQRAEKRRARGRKREMRAAYIYLHKSDTNMYAYAWRHARKPCLCKRHHHIRGCRLGMQECVPHARTIPRGHQAIILGPTRPRCRAREPRKHLLSSYCFGRHVGACSTHGAPAIEPLRMHKCTSTSVSSRADEEDPR